MADTPNTQPIYLGRAIYDSEKGYHKVDYMDAIIFATFECATQSGGLKSIKRLNSDRNPKDGDNLLVLIYPMMIKCIVNNKDSYDTFLAQGDLDTASKKLCEALNSDYNLPRKRS